MRKHGFAWATLALIAVTAPARGAVPAFTLRCEVENTLNIFANVRTGGNDDSQEVKTFTQEYRVDPAAGTVTVRYRNVNGEMRLDEHAADIVAIGPTMIVFCDRAEGDPQCGEAAFKRAPEGKAYGTGMTAPVVINLADGALHSSSMWNMTIWPSSRVVASWFVTNNVWKGTCIRHNA